MATTSSTSMSTIVHAPSSDDPLPNNTPPTPTINLIPPQPSDESITTLHPSPHLEQPQPVAPWIAQQQQPRPYIVWARETRKSMSLPLLWKKSTQNSATILRAVPESTEGDNAGPHPNQRDMAIRATNTTNDNASQATDGTPSSSTFLTKTAKCKKDDSTSSAESRPVSDLKSMFNSTPLKGTIGTYKHGKIQWRLKDRSASDPELKNKDANKTSRPKIQVIIPGVSRDRPLPNLPFFGSLNKVPQVVSSPDNIDISPPSANDRPTSRNSMVSPLAQQQSQPMPFGQFQRTVQSVPNLTSHQKKSGSRSSVDSQESDASSTFSNQSSETSIEAEPETASNVRSISKKQSCESNSAFKAAGDNTRHRLPPSLNPPRQYGHDQESSFQPSCKFEPSRLGSFSITRKPTLTRKSSKRMMNRRSLAKKSSMGIINEAISRSSDRKVSNPQRSASPTLSEAENDLQEQLTSFVEETSRLEVNDDSEQPWTSITEDSPFKWDDVVLRTAENDAAKKENANEQPRKDSATVVTPPAVPRKSSKRQSMQRASFVPTSPATSEMTRGRSRKRSQRKSQRLTITIPDYKRSTEEQPKEVVQTEEKRTITPRSAELVILGILRSLDHLDDLFATAVVNRGFYRVFKRHELDLIKGTLRKMSAPAWEFREIAFPGHDLLHAEDLEMTRPDEEYTPSTYLQLQKRDVHVVRSIKAQIKDKCQSFVRPEISVALVSDDPFESARVDDALWRIWTFCKIFGSGKGREEDIVAQMDWLKGGALVHQKACTFSIMTTDYMNDTLVGAPECFGKGNEDGLSAEELFDMMELWNCLGVLLQGFEGRTSEARKAGVYDNTDIRGGDIDGEELMLDEWCYHLLTSGLSTVLELADSCRQKDSAAFQTAQQKGWVQWKAPTFGGTRRNFLKEAASRVYEDKIAHTYASTSTRDVQRAQSKIRIQKHISELRNRKNSGRRLPTIRMSQERPMSDWDTVIGNLTRPRPSQTNRSDIVSYIPPLRSALAHELSTTIAELPSARTPPPPSSPSRRVIAAPLLPTPPPSTAPSKSDRNSIAISMPSIEEHPAHRRNEYIPEMPSLNDHPMFRNANVDIGSAATPNPQHVRQNSDLSVYSHTSNGSSPRKPAFEQHHAQRSIYGSESYENTADKAIYRIVEMGFTADQAREALRMTDLGDGLRVDRAVELLLSRSR